MYPIRPPTLSFGPDTKLFYVIYRRKLFKYHILPSNAVFDV